MRLYSIYVGREALRHESRIRHQFVTRQSRGYKQNDAGCAAEFAWLEGRGRAHFEALCFPYYTLISDLAQIPRAKKLHVITGA